jgi:polyphosphate glucokinase
VDDLPHHHKGGASADKPLTLAIDIGGTGLKASVVDSAGEMTVPRVRIKTPSPLDPQKLIDALEELVAPLPKTDRISAGFPGVVRAGRIITAPHFDGDDWANFPLAEVLSQRFGKPARVLNDAEVQGLGIIGGKGLEVVLTLGTGVGSAIFVDGRLAPHIELAQHPLRHDMTYNEYVGDAARKSLELDKWRRRVGRMIEAVRILTNYEVLYIGGGNASELDPTELPHSVHLASNDAGITGGIGLWADGFTTGF